MVFWDGILSGSRLRDVSANVADNGLQRPKNRCFRMTCSEFETMTLILVSFGGGAHFWCFGAQVLVAMGASSAADELGVAEDVA